MWMRIKIGLLLCTALALLLFLHYSLPQRDIVRIVGTDTRIVSVGENSWFYAQDDAGSAPSQTRDLRLINAQTAEGATRVYRNEDTGWSWPPYLKFNSSDVHAEAQAVAKTDETWVAVRHYGWRFNIFSTYPNALSIREVDGPDVSLIPWFNIIFLIVLAMVVWGVGVRVKRWFSTILARRWKMSPAVLASRAGGCVAGWDSGGAEAACSSLC